MFVTKDSMYLIKLENILQSCQIQASASNKEKFKIIFTV